MLLVITSQLVTTYWYVHHKIHNNLHLSRAWSYSDHCSQSVWEIINYPENTIKKQLRNWLYSDYMRLDYSSLAGHRFLMELFLQQNFGCIKKNNEHDRNVIIILSHAIIFSHIYETLNTIRSCLQIFIMQYTNQLL